MVVADVIGAIAGTLAALSIALLAVLSRLIYRNARDIASLAQRLARLEGHDRGTE